MVERMPEPGKARAASVFDVAKAAGVSHQTVSRVLNDHPSVRPATRQKVLDAMQALQYRPNLAARALVTSRSRIIGILSTAGGEYGPASSVAAIEAAARARGYSVNIANADGVEQASIDEAVEHLVALSVEGIVIVAPQPQVLATLAAHSFGVPFVTLQALEHAGAAGVTDGDAVAIDQHLGARLATAHLAELGHTRIGHLAGPSDWIDATSRLAGFEAELAARGLSPVEITAGDWSSDSGYTAASTLFAAGATAVFAANDQMALGLLHAAQDAGIRVPEELSVVGFDDTPEARHYLPPLTTVRQDFAEAGRRALALLLDGADAAPSVEPVLVMRASTAAPLPRILGA
ncbi:LacI family DNA-binding transcriptional regulator [Herbiconiux sp. 11R-BC]|uniref:LacI family DNA-binding transcriptional regulator n=1 Tax=Herbiconiux sp. 11R-BC TaxID=3111637 RepID=UPI003C11AF39